MAARPTHEDVRFWRDDALPGVEARLSVYRKTAFRTHTHAEYTVSLVEQGKTRFPLDNTMISAHEGQIVLINPRQAHSCNPDPETGISYRLFYVAAGWLAGASPDTLPPLFLTPVVEDPELFDAWRELHLRFTDEAAPTGEKQARLLACLQALVARHASPAPSGPEHEAIARARQHLHTSPQGEWTPLNDLAQIAGLSPHHFARTFKAATGLPPHAYQLQLALEHAKKLLADGLPISQAALDCGFADQSHFSRTFRQFTGATPGQYAQAK